MKKLAALLFIFILFLSPFAIAEEGTTETTQPSPPPTEPSPPPSETPTTQPQQPTEPIAPEPSSGGGGEGGGSPAPPPKEHKEDSQCPPPPSPSCNQDQRAEPFYQNGCLSGYNCVPRDGQEGPRDQPPESRCPPDRACMKGEECVPCPGQGQQFQNIPPGCHVEQGEFGEFIKCEQDKRYEEEKKRGEEDCRKHNGKFIIRPGTTAWECVAQGQQGFFQQGQCPSNEQLKQIEDQCSASKGKTEHFRDRSGCEAVSCRQEFSQGHGSEEEKIKFMALGCEEQGGQFVFDERGPNCIGGQQQIRINRDLKPLDGVELLKVALEMESVIQVFNEISAKLESLENYYQSKGDEEKAKAFEIALSQLDGAMNRLDEIRIGLAENADSLQEEDRYAVLGDMQQINSIIKDVAVTLLTGGKSKRAATQRFEKRAEGGFESEFEGPEGISQEEGFDILQGFQNCAEFSEDDPFKFSPEPGVSVKLEGLKDRNCVMKVNPPEMPGEITLLLPPEVYQFFDGPHLLLRDDVECSPDFACKMMRQQLQREARPPERFGEQERQREFREGNVQDFQGPEFPEPRGRFEQPKSGELRPSQCDGAELNNEECAKWAINTNTLEKIPQCKGLTEEQCTKLLKNSWDRAFENKGFEQPQQQFPQEFKGGEFKQEFEQKGYPSPEQFKQFEQYQSQYPQQYNYPQQQFPQQSFQGSSSAGFCGDGSIAPSLGEECDDRNNKDGDGCSASCKVEQQPVAVANVIKNFGDWMRGE